MRTFVKNGLPLKLGGVGPELAKCKNLAKGHNNIEFLEFVNYEDLPNLYAGAKAFLFPAEEDFGLTPVEAMAAGTPVIALGKGGALESVSKESGIFFSDPTVESLQKSIDSFEKDEQPHHAAGKKFSSKKIKNRAQQFDEKVFQNNLNNFITSVVSK